MNRMAGRWQEEWEGLSHIWDEAYRLCDDYTIPRTRAFMLFYRAFRYGVEVFAGSFADAVQALKDAAPHVAEELGIPIPAPLLKYGEKGDCFLAWRAWVARKISRDRIAQLSDPLWTGPAVLEILDAIQAGQMPGEDL